MLTCRCRYSTLLINPGVKIVLFTQETQTTCAAILTNNRILYPVVLHPCRLTWRTCKSFRDGQAGGATVQASASTGHIPIPETTGPSRDRRVRKNSVENGHRRTGFPRICREVFYEDKGSVLAGSWLGALELRNFYPTVPPAIIMRWIVIHKDP